MQQKIYLLSCQSLLFLVFLLSGFVWFATFFGTGRANLFAAMINVLFLAGSLFAIATFFSNLRKKRLSYFGNLFTGALNLVAWLFFAAMTGFPINPYLTLFSILGVIGIVLSILLLFFAWKSKPLFSEAKK